MGAPIRPGFPDPEIPHRNVGKIPTGGSSKVLVPFFHKRPTGGPSRPRGRVAASLAATVLALGCAGAGGPREVALDPLVIRDRSPSPLQPVSFLAGCWRGESASGGTLIEERWTPAGGGVMLGTTRYSREGEVVGWEFAHLGTDGSVILLTPYPGGERSEHSFRWTGGGPGRAVFEAPEHDFPKRITYEVTDEGGLRVSIDGGAGDPEPRSWTLRTVPCSPGTDAGLGARWG